MLLKRKLPSLNRKEIVRLLVQQKLKRRLKVVKLNVLTKFVW